MASTARIIDFHSHYYDTAWYSSSFVQGQASLARAIPLLGNISAQLAAMDKAEIDAKVLSAPAAVLVAPGESLPMSTIERINNELAALVSAHPQHLLALATIDAFQGDAAAREVERVVQELGLHGICIDCAHSGRFLDVQEARPTLEVAAALRVPVFVHPVSPAGLTERFASLGHTGVLLARGTENAASLLSILRGGILDVLPALTLVFPMIGVAALVFAGIADQEFGRGESWQGGTPSRTRTRLYIDTMGFDIATIRFAIELLGADHVLLGSDWPIMPIAPRPYIMNTLKALNLSETQRDLILAGNTLRLLKQSRIE